VATLRWRNSINPEWASRKLSDLPTWRWLAQPAHLLDVLIHNSKSKFRLPHSRTESTKVTSPVRWSPNKWSNRLFKQEHITNDRTGNQSCHFHHYPPCLFVRNTHLDSPGTCSAVPFEKGQPSSTAFRPPASDPSGTTPRVKRRKINYLTESAHKDLSISNATRLACDSVQSTLGIRFSCICVLACALSGREGNYEHVGKL
jgi:hypothetical protein